MRLVVLATFVLSSACAPIKVDPDPTRAAVQINSGIDRLASVENAVVVNLVRLRGEPARSIEPPLRLVLDSLPLRGVAKGNPIVVAPGRYVWQPSPTVDAGRPAAADVFFIRALAAAGFASGGDADAGYRVVLDEIAARDDEPPDAFFSRLQERLVGCVLSSLRVQWGIVARPPGDPHLASSLRRSVLATPPYRGVEYSRAQPTLLFRMPLTAGATLRRGSDVGSVRRAVYSLPRRRERIDQVAAKPSAL